MKDTTLLHLLMDMSVHNRDPPEAALCVSCCVFEATGSYQRCQ